MLFGWWKLGKVGMVAVAMENDCLDICLSDGLPCSCHVKGVGIGLCVKDLRGEIIVCCRFSDVTILEFSNRKKVRGEAYYGYGELIGDLFDRILRTS